MSSPTPAPRFRPASQAGATSLTERRKAATRMDIARAAAGLFVRQGLRATRADDIARAAGIAPRTFYRYFATKEEAVAPLYAAGAQRWAEAVAEAPAGLSVPKALEHAVRHTLTPGAGVSASSWELVRTLIRLTETSPALGKVWAEVCHRSEGRLGEVLAGRLGEVSAGMRAGDADAGARAGVGAGASDFGVDEGAGAGAGAGVGGVGVEEDAGAGAGDVGAASGAAEAAGASAATADFLASADSLASATSAAAAASPRLRFAAAVAGAAVRVAVEAWAAGEAPATGPQGPAAMALRNLETLRDFPWGEIAAEGR